MGSLAILLWLLHSSWLHPGPSLTWHEPHPDKSKTVLSSGQARGILENKRTNCRCSGQGQGQPRMALTCRSSATPRCQHSTTKKSGLQPPRPHSWPDLSLSWWHAAFYPDRLGCLPTSRAVKPDDWCTCFPLRAVQATSGTAWPGPIFSGRLETVTWSCSELSTMHSKVESMGYHNSSRLFLA